MSTKRKPPHLTEQQQDKVRALAAALGCTEAKILRQAIDRLPAPEAIRRHLEALPEPQRTTVRQLLAAGLVAAPDEDEDVPADPEEIEALEREHEAWLATLSEPLGLTEAVLEDRRCR